MEGLLVRETREHHAADLRGRESAEGNARIRRRRRRSRTSCTPRWPRNSTSGEGAISASAAQRPAGAKPKPRSATRSIRPIAKFIAYYEQAAAQDHRQQRRVGTAGRRCVLRLGRETAHHHRHDPGAGASAGPVGSGAHRSGNGRHPARRRPVAGQRRCARAGSFASGPDQLYPDTDAGTDADH